MCQVSCVVLSVTLAARLMAAELPLLTGGTSQSVRLKITLTPREVYVCSTSHSLEKQQELVWCYKHSCRHSRLGRNPAERSERPQSRFHSFAWRTNMEPWGGRMFSFAEFEKFERRKILSPERLAGGNERGAAAVCTMRSLLMWANPTSNLWEGNLWQQANFSKKKQTFQSINGLIVWIKLKHYKDLLLGAPSSWFQEAEGAVGGLLTGAKLHPDVWICSGNVTAAHAEISKEKRKESDEV